MSESIKNNKNFRALSNYYFTLTKRWWAATWYLKFAVFIIGIIAVLFPNISIYITIFIGILSFLSEIANVKSNGNKGIAEGFLRKLDLRDSFGWEISNLEIADAVVGLSKKAKAQLTSGDQPDNYFATSENEGWRRAMHNLQESAWWSKHLAKFMGRYCFTMTIVLAVVSVLALIFSSLLIPTTEQSTNINRIVIGVLLLIVSLGLIPLTINYFNFSKKSEKSEQIATELLKSDIDNTIQAIKAINEYHLTRASAPLLPTWLWKRKNKTLNEAWKEFVLNQE